MNRPLVSVACLLALSTAGCSLVEFLSGDTDPDCSNTPTPTPPTTVPQTLAMSTQSLIASISVSTDNTIMLSLAESPYNSATTCPTFTATATLNGEQMAMPTDSQGAQLVDAACGELCCSGGTYVCEGPSFTAPFDLSLAQYGQWNFVVSDSSGSFTVDVASPETKLDIVGPSLFASRSTAQLQASSATVDSAQFDAQLVQLVLATAGGDVIADLTSSTSANGNDFQNIVPTLGSANTKIGGPLVPCDAAIDQLPCSAVFAGFLLTSAPGDGLRCDFDSCNSNVPVPFKLPLVLTSDAIDTAASDAGSNDACDAGD